MFNLATSWLDVLAVVGSLSLFAGYQAFLMWQVRRNPHYSIQAVNNRARTAWVESVMREGRDILAIQTLRNSTMAATFLASTAVLLVIGTLTLMSHGEDLQHVWQNIYPGSHALMHWWTVKVLLLLADFFIAFFCFTLSIRSYNHVGFLINVPQVLHATDLSVGRVATQLNRAARYFTIGMRAYYTSVPLLLWLFGPWLMLAGSVVVVAALWFIDRAPQDI